MGDLLHILRDDQRRMEEAAETIPGLLVQHFDEPAKSPRAEVLMAINAEQRELIETLTERNDALARRLADLTAEVSELRGDKLTPWDAQHVIARMPIPGSGGAYATVEINDDPEYGQLEVGSVLIGGRLVALSDLIDSLNDSDLILKAVAEAREHA